VQTSALCIWRTPQNVRTGHLLPPDCGRLLWAAPCRGSRLSRLIYS